MPNEKTQTLDVEKLSTVKIIKYRHWYNRDKNRFFAERDAMMERFYTGIHFKDGRLGFYKEATEEEPWEVAIIFDWMHPIKPPEFIAKAKRAASSAMKELIKNLIKAKDIYIELLPGIVMWTPRILAADLIDYWQDLVAGTMGNSKKAAGKVEIEKAE